MTTTTKTKEGKKIISHLKHYGFINPNAEIYQGLAKSWDFGTNGAELKKNLKDLWWEYFIKTSPYNFACETAILTHNKVLEASGHKKNFNDWVVECQDCKRKVRLDNLTSEEEFLKFLLLSDKDKSSFNIKEKCSCGGGFSHPNQFNLMLKAEICSLNKQKTDEQSVYLRPETCQGIFINFTSIKNSVKKRLPFGIGQIGKSFRNEVTLNHGIFRTREFEQAELEFFVSEKKEEWWEFWTNKSWEFFRRIMLNDELIAKKKIEKEGLPHYSLKTLDFQFKYEFGWGEVCSVSDRGDYDLRNHSEKSSHFLGIRDEKGKKIIPNIIEVSFGIERLLLAILENGYKEEITKLSNIKRKYLKINPLLSPFFVSVMSLSKQLNKEAYELYLDLIKTGDFSVSYEETGSIGNKYRRQDAIGTFFCITLDFETINDKRVTVRDRDSMKQTRILISKVKNYLFSEMKNFKEKFLS